MENVSRRWTLGSGTVALTAMLAHVGAIVAGVVLSHVAYHQFAYGTSGDALRALNFAGLAGLVFAGLGVAGGLYEIEALARGRRFNTIFSAWNAAFVAAILLAFVTKQTDALSRGAVILSYPAGLIVAALAYRMLSAAVRRLSVSGNVEARRVLVIGRESEIRDFVAANPPGAQRLRVIDAIVLPEGDGDAERIVARAVERARELEPDDIVLAIPMRESALVERCVDALETVPAALHLLQEPIFRRFRDIGLSSVGQAQAIVLTRPRLTPLDLFAKRAFDLTAATAATIVLSPLMLAIAAAIRLESHGPALFRQARYGFNQEPFRIFKFRTMTTMEDAGHIRQATRDDERITRVGAFLRRTNLDELPQLFNVIAGDMSLVGPRPHAVSHNRYYEQRVASYARRHNVKPGITGWAQINGLRGETDTDEKMKARVVCDLYYLDNWSLALDLKILVRTVFSIRAYNNAY
ncbi:MAG: undecaprenyl-phosphate glucose phosphotransferase [Flavobacteriaceae bacterium]